MEKKEANGKEINLEIKKEILYEVFELSKDTKNKGNYFHFMRNVGKDESIFFLVKMIVKSNFLSEENKQYIETNIIKILKNNFRKEHLNYFYKIIKKILIKFNCFNKDLIEGNLLLSENIGCEKCLNNINSDFSFLVKINEILIQVIKDEKKQKINKECYYCDKGFIFNSKEKERIGFKVKDIIYTKKSNNIFCILFSFQLNELKIEKKNKIIFSIVDSANNEILTLFENGINICIRYMDKNLVEINLHKVEYNTNFNYIFFKEKNKIRICINNEDILNEKEADFELPDKFQVFIGCPEYLKKDEYTFNGIIYPILLFELKESKKNKDINEEFKKLLFSIKNTYYLLAEEYFNYQNNIKNRKAKDIENIERIVNNYEIYNNLGENLIKRKQVKIFFNMLSNIILYIDPKIVFSSFNKKATSFKDCNIYKNENTKDISYFYEFNILPLLGQGKIYTFNNFNIVSFFKINNGINFIILQIEVLFNYILLIENKKEYLELVNKNKTNFYEKM